MDGENRNFFEDLKDTVIDYLQAKARLTKIQAFEKMARVLGVIFLFFVIFIFFCFVVIFTGLMLGFLLADLTNSNALGFSIVAVLFIIVLIILVVRRKSMLERPVMENIAKVLFEDDDEDIEITRTVITEKTERDVAP